MICRFVRTGTCGFQEIHTNDYIMSRSLLVPNQIYLWWVPSFKSSHPELTSIIPRSSPDPTFLHDLPPNLVVLFFLLSKSVHWTSPNSYLLWPVISLFAWEVAFRKRQTYSMSEACMAACRLCSKTDHHNSLNVSPHILDGVGAYGQPAGTTLVLPITKLSTRSISMQHYHAL